MVSSILGGKAEKYGEPICVQFVNTVGARRSGTPNEYLPDPAALSTWLVGHRLIESSDSIDFLYLSRAIDLRNALYTLFSRVASGSDTYEEALDALNGELCEALAKVELTSNMRWSLTEADPLERALMSISLSAAELLTSTLSDRIRECADSECGWIFIDHSKNRSRRWCSMSDCGNLAKARRFQERKRRAL